MTEAELLAQAKAEALQTTLTPAQFLRMVKTRPAYQYELTHWYKAMQALEQLKHQPTPPAPTPTPPAQGRLTAMRNLLVFASVTDDAVQQACRLGPSWRILYTADPAYRVTQTQMNAAKAAGMGPYTWIGPDCPPTMATEFRDRWAASGITVPGWYGEGETTPGFDQHTGFTPWPTIGLIGNLTALRPDQNAQVKNGSVLFSWERYLNKADQQIGNFNAYLNNTGPYQGLGGFCGAVYESAGEGATYLSVAQQVANGWVEPRQSWYVEGFRPEDWQALR
jgi:hypothetical protein